jgi:NADH-quinone oxidoreductase subunit L
VLSVWPGEPDRRLTRAVAVAMPALGFIGTLIIFIVMTTRSAQDRIEISILWNWVQSDGLSIDLAIQIDTLSVLMMLIITGVGSLIVIYSTSYMDEDRDYKRFFAEMSFFIFSMLLLVEAANYFFLIVGWGLSASPRTC